MEINIMKMLLIYCFSRAMHSSLQFKFKMMATFPEPPFGLPQGNSQAFEGFVGLVYIYHGALSNPSPYVSVP